MARGPSPSDPPGSEPWVATYDHPAGLPLSEARLMAKRFWYMGWFGLPLAWATNAYYFWPHVKGEVVPEDGNDARAELRAGREGSEGPSSNARTGGQPTILLDPIVKKYATQSFRGAQAAFFVLLAWAATFLVGGKELFGEKLWNRLSVTAQPPAE